jgi:ribosomal subunit interface protein
MNLQITFRDFDSSDSIRAYVEKRAAKLLAHSDRVVALKVALESPHRHHPHGHSYRVRIEIVVPGSDIVVTPRHHEGADGHADLYAAIDEAFDAAGDRLRDHAQIRRGEVKSHLPA